MLLVVEGDRVSYARVRSLAATPDIERAASIEGARERCRAGDPAAVLLDRDVGCEPVRRFVRDLEEGEFGRPRVPVIAVVGGDASVPERGVDEVVTAPVGDRELRTAIERATLVGEYKDAVRELFYACRELAERDRAPSRDFERAREQADRRLRELSSRGERLPFEQLIGGA